MLDRCAPGDTREDKTHHQCVRSAGRTFPRLPLVAHGRRRFPSVEVGFVRQMARHLGIGACAQAWLDDLRIRRRLRRQGDFRPLPCCLNRPTEGDDGVGRPSASCRRTRKRSRHSARCLRKDRNASCFERSTIRADTSCPGTSVGRQAHSRRSSDGALAERAPVGRGRLPRPCPDPRVLGHEAQGGDPLWREFQRGFRVGDELDGSGHGLDPRTRDRPLRRVHRRHAVPLVGSCGAQVVQARAVSGKGVGPSSPQSVDELGAAHRGRGTPGEDESGRGPRQLTIQPSEATVVDNGAHARLETRRPLARKAEPASEPKCRPDVSSPSERRVARPQVSAVRGVGAGYVAQSEARVQKPHGRNAAGPRPRGNPRVGRSP
jgi:hypothetical protein